MERQGVYSSSSFFFGFEKREKVKSNASLSINGT